MKKLIKWVLNKLGYKVTLIEKENPYPPDLDKDFLNLYEKCKPYTMTSIERMYSLYKAVEYIAINHIEGDMVECGVWRGGSSMMIALTLLKYKNGNRKLYLYDTFEGMSAPTDDDVDFQNKKAEKTFNETLNEKGNSEWCYASIEEVKSNMLLIGYNIDNLIFVKGKVEDTIPQTIPDKIALLRLDTDWYESTYHEMINLYPMLIAKGVLIIDDYGYWQGSKKAIDKFIKDNSLQILLNRIDNSGRIGIKI